ncbi:uncharacterized protein [Epargyreus clarus]|uniref:uncharacterized protein n=1 Tax=Epargyreus clarus TaxID=520877 RepID=UPI003C2AB066
MFGVALLTSTLLVLADARIYERCELARDLLSLGISKEHVATWVCIAYHESRFDTAARNPHSGDHGLLQISELYWCGVGKACGLPCSALRDDDISDDVECALRVHEEHTRLQGNGFLAWVVYPHHCKHNAKKYLADCDTSVKTYAVRPTSRARVMKIQTRNFTTFSYNPKIDELQPPYLAVNSFLRGSYEKEFEENYNKNVRVNWLDYKVDNIDDLKLPDFNQKVRDGHRTTTPATIRTFATTRALATRRTLATTTTTTSSPLPNIKPPSPRRIESNSFRRRKMRPIPEIESVKLSGSTDQPTTTTSSSTTTPRSLYKSSTEYYVTREKVQQTTSASILPLITMTTTIKPATEKVDLSSPSVSTISRTIYQTTKLSDFQRSTTARTTVAQNVFTKTTEAKLSTTTARSTQNIIKDQQTKLTSTTSTTRSRTWPTWRTTPYKSTSASTTSKPSTKTWNRTWRTPKYSSSRSESSNKNITSTKPNNEQTTTVKPSITTRTWHEAKSLSTQLPRSNNYTYSTRNLLVQSTTPRSRVTWPTANSRSTPSPSTVRATSRTTTTTKIVTSTASPSPTTARTTQSIFDLYLNPTKRPKLAFTFAPFKSSGLSLKIFAGGTTTHSPAFSTNENPKTASGDAAKNQIRRQAWQNT